MSLRERVQTILRENSEYIVANRKVPVSRFNEGASYAREDVGSRLTEALKATEGEGKSDGTDYRAKYEALRADVAGVTEIYDQALVKENRHPALSLMMKLIEPEDAWEAGVQGAREFVQQVLAKHPE